MAETTIYRRCVRSGNVIALIELPRGAYAMQGMCGGCGSLHVYDPEAEEGGYFNKETVALAAPLTP